MVVVRTANSSRKIWLWGGAERERNVYVLWGAGRIFNYRTDLMIMCRCQWRRPGLGGDTFRPGH